MLVFSFLNSMSTYVVTSGIVYLTDGTYHFSRVQNYILGLTLGVTYVFAALLAGPLLRRVRNHSSRLTSRRVLGIMMLAMALLCQLPLLASLLAPHLGVASIWALVILYSPLTGVLWPIVESYVSGGLRAQPLLRFIGRWNVVWSSSLVIASIGTAPFVETLAPWAISILGLFHLASTAWLTRFQPEPAGHLHDSHPVPASYPPLLVTFRVLLPTSYLVLMALTPALPKVMGQIGIPASWSTIVAASWLAARPLAFLGMQRRTGWHGRLWPALVAPTLMMLGFGVAVLCGRLFPGAPGAVSWGGVACLVASLGVFGAGMAMIYSAAIYYAMEVGAAEVDAGGAHEGLIGVGYTVGPLIGLCAAVATDRRWLPGQESFEPAMLVGVTLVALIALAVVAWRVWMHRPVSAGPSVG